MARPTERCRRLPWLALAGRRLFVLGGLLLATAVLSTGPSVLPAADALPEQFIGRYCLDCHSGEEATAGIELDAVRDRSWSDHETSVFFERVLKAVRSGQMPPEDADRPTQAERDAASAALHSELMRNSGVGGTVLRRLNRSEYENTIRVIFGIDFEVPAGFPADTQAHGFDNTGDGLVLSGPLMEAWFESATTVADHVFPPPVKPAPSVLARISASDLVISYSSGAVIDNALRLAAKTDVLFRSSTWPAKYEVKTPAKYRIRVSASQFADTPRAAVSFDGPMKLQIRARSLNDSDGSPVSKQRLLAEFQVTSEQPTDFDCVVEMYPAETPVLYFANGPLDSDRDDKDEFSGLLRRMFDKDKRLLAGWLQVEHGSGLRGGLGWERVKAIRDSADLDLSDLDMSTEAVDALVKKMQGNSTLYVETMTYHFFEEGPCLEIHGVEIEGPLEIVESPQQRQARLTAARVLGQPTADNQRTQVRQMMAEFLTKVFRRPATDVDVGGYTNLVMDHVHRGHTLSDGLHLAIRTALLSPRFLYRGHRPGKLDDFDLAARLAYFLTGGPPDKALFEAAQRGQLTDPPRLRQEAGRLIESGERRNFVANFTGQWLRTRELADIMPDARLLDFDPEDRQAMIDETEMFFTEILSQNLPLETFIQPDFTYMNKRLAEKVYGRDDVTHDKVQRVALRKGDRYGGILGQASVMMATANGVDTQPVVRGVWVLENVLGDPPPEPPQNVPAITPDTRGAKTVRDLLVAHRADEGCAVCHRKIDPIGFVLESFDPVGRWRTHYPVYSTNEKGKPVTADGPPIDPTGQYPGAEFADIDDLRTYVVEHVDEFANCLSQKLLVYATGRPVSYAEKQEIREIVSGVRQQAGGFRDLLIALIQSEAFLTK